MIALRTAPPVARHGPARGSTWRDQTARHAAWLAARAGSPLWTGLVPFSAATAEPDSFRLLFQHAAREPEFRAWAQQFQRGMTEAAHRQIGAVVAHPTWARWASQLAPVVAVEAIIAWLDAGQPDPDQAAERIGQAIDAVITAAARSTVDRQPSPTSRRRAP